LYLKFVCIWLLNCGLFVLKTCALFEIVQPSGT
jgi:hypothetical protein